MTGATDDASYEVRFAPAAAKELGKLRADDAARLRRTILGLAFEPRPAGVRGVAGTRYLRLRVGDLRVIYLVMDDQRLVVITRIAKRSERTYRRLQMLLAVTGRTAEEILGPMDATKVRSSMTLFHRATPAEPLFAQVLDSYYEGIADEATDALLR